MSCVFVNINTETQIFATNLYINSHLKNKYILSRLVQPNTFYIIYCQYIN